MSNKTLPPTESRIPATIMLLDGIGNNLTVNPGYVIATTLKPGYLRTTEESAM